MKSHTSLTSSLDVYVLSVLRSACFNLPRKMLAATGSERHISHSVLQSRPLNVVLELLTYSMEQSHS